MCFVSDNLADRADIEINWSDILMLTKCFKISLILPIMSKVDDELLSGDF